MRILLVEDDPSAAHVLAKGLREQSYAVDVAGDGDVALFQAGTNDYDGLILDVMLPLVDGLKVCRAIRDAGSAVPILMLTARDAVEARVEGLDAGADDYLDQAVRLPRADGAAPGADPPRPSAGSAGAAGRRAAHHRHPQPACASSAIGRSCCARRNTRCSNTWPGTRATSLTRSDIAEHVWDEHYDPVSNVVDVCVQRLRRKIDPPGHESLIRTRRGEGYQLAADGS